MSLSSTNVSFPEAIRIAITNFISEINICLP